MSAEEDMCPICRSSRYLNPDMKFLVNPECYHKMCESCVDRIFSVGPAPCPYKGCGKILRKTRFKQQVFSDLTVEREVDVRQRVLRIYNRKRNNFDTDDEYDNYLESIEDIIYGILDGGKSAADAEQQLVDYEREHKQEILQNAVERRNENSHAAALEQAVLERQHKLRNLAVEIEQRELEIAEQYRQETISQLSAGAKSSEEIMAEMNRRIAEKTKELRESYQRELERSAADLPAKKVSSNATLPVPQTPFTPFAGDLSRAEHFDQKDEYYDPTMDRAKDPAVQAGGFSIRAAQTEALTLAFLSLDVDVQAEKQATAVAV